MDTIVFTVNVKAAERSMTFRTPPRITFFSFPILACPGLTVAYAQSPAAPIELFEKECEASVRGEVPKLPQREAEERWSGS